MIKFEDKRQLILDGFDAYGVRHRLRAGHFHPSNGVSKSLLGCHMDFLSKRNRFAKRFKSLAGISIIIYTTSIMHA